MGRKGQAVVILSLLIALASTAWNGINTIKIAGNEANNAINEQAIHDLREANKLREKAGLPPIPLPPPGEQVDVSAVASAAAAMVLDQMRHDPRFKGPQGLRGEPCVPEVPGCTGKPGAAGTDGSRGQDGDPGVQGPKGDPCSPMVDPTCQGPKGDPGVDGKDGLTGPAIVSFTFTIGIVTYECIDTEPKDLQYECNPSPSQ